MNYSRSSLLSVVLVAIAGMATLGCGSADNMAPVKGVVTVGGEPVPSGTIQFIPASGGRPATGQIGSDGSYALSTKTPGDGVPPGEYKVIIEAKQTSGGGGGDISVPSGPVKVTWLAPQKYSTVASSDLTATVESGTNEINFPLDSK